MKIDVKPNLPFISRELVKEYKGKYEVKKTYDVYSLDDDFNVVEGIGKIDSDNNYNYHNNYDDSEDTLLFHPKIGYNWGKNQYWTESKAEIDELRNQEINRVINILTDKIGELLNKKLAEI